MNKFSIRRSIKAISDLVSGLGVYSQPFEVRNIVDDTRRIQPGDTFLCLPRAKNVEGLLADARERGAASLIFVGTPERDADLPCACLPDMEATGQMLRRWFETEDIRFPLIGVTGTDGKTSTTWMLRELLAHCCGSAWSCGTLGLIREADDMQDLGNTTPSLLTLHTLLALADQEGIGAMVLEVSSHGIEQQRIAGMPFAAAIWTTMGQDHLEDHGGFEAYMACKKGFVQAVAKAGGVVVANKDYDLITAALSGLEGKVFWYSQHSNADLMWSLADGLTLDDGHTQLRMKQVPVAGFHGENLTAAALLMKELFVMPLASLQVFDGKISTPIGRLEPVDAGNQVFIDYAHTAEGLTRCMESARASTGRQLLLVFGCGGNRDKSKRPEMGAVAVKYADQCWLTSDNPRDEEQSDIVRDVLGGVGVNANKIHVCDDRNEAIEQAVLALGQSDVLVIAGKGHESYMEIKGERFPWSDKASALSALRKKEVQACA